MPHRYQSLEENEKKTHTWSEILILLTIRSSVLSIASLTSTAIFAIFGRGGLWVWIGLSIEFLIFITGWKSAKACRLNGYKTGYSLSYGLICSLFGYLIRLIAWMTILANIAFLLSVALFTWLTVMVSARYYQQKKIDVEYNVTTEDLGNTDGNKTFNTWTAFRTLWTEEAMPRIKDAWIALKKTTIARYIWWIIDDPLPAIQYLRSICASMLDRLADFTEGQKDHQTNKQTQEEDEL